jgi:formate dehydrogenase subunit gamma
MKDEVVLRHPASSRVVHIIHMICWTILGITGFAVYFDLVGEATKALFMEWHIYLAIILTFATIGYVVITPDRAFLFLKEILNWDSDTIAWWKNFGGYPYKFLGNTPLYKYIKRFWFAKPGCPPQSKYNAGQKLFGLCVVASLLILGVTGWSLYFFPQALGKFWAKLFFNLHVWVSLLVSLFMITCHVPLVIYNWPDFVAMFRPGAGVVPLEWAKEHNPKWVERELVEIKELEKS